MIKCNYITAITFLLMIVISATAIYIPKPKLNYDPNEVFWFGTSGCYLVMCRANGMVTSYDRDTWKVLKEFKVDNFASNKQQLCISRQLNTLAILDERVGMRESGTCSDIVFYDFLKGEMIRSVEVVRAPPAAGKGFDSQGNLYYVSDWDILCRINPGSGLVEKERIDPILYQLQVYYDKNILVEFCKDGRWRARKYMGSEIWGNDKYSIDVGPFPVESSGRIFIMYDFEHKKTMGFNSADGQLIWVNNSTTDMLAAQSYDCNMQAFYGQGTLQITHLPEDKKVSIQNIPDELEVVFTNDNRYVICLPKLKELSKSEDGREIKMARPSNEFSVYDTETGELVKKFSIPVTN